MFSTIQRWFSLGLLALVAAAFLACPAHGAKLHLKDGRVLEGEVQKEGDGYIWFVVSVGGIKDAQIFTSDQIKSIDRDGLSAATVATTVAPGAATGTKPTLDAKPEVTPPAPEVSVGGATRVCFISLEEEVGTLLNADALKESVRRIEDENPDVIVLVINSGGGSLGEVEPLSDQIHKEMKKKYRVVSWVQSAISAASMTAWNTEEIYMMREGNIGGTVAFRMNGGQAKAASGVNLQEILRMGEELSRRGKRNPLIMRGMQIFSDLSADIDQYGNVSWFEGLQGKHTVNTQERILTFNSQDALKFGISLGTADTKDELMKLLRLKEWVEVGEDADEYQREFRSNVQTTQARIGELMQKYDMALQAAGRGGGSDPKDRNQYIGRARRYLDELQSMIRRAPSLEKYTQFNKEWFEQKREELRKLANPDNRG